MRASWTYVDEEAWAYIGLPSGEGPTSGNADATEGRVLEVLAEMTGAFGPVEAARLLFGEPLPAYIVAGLPVAPAVTVPAPRRSVEGQLEAIGRRAHHRGLGALSRWWSR